MRPVLIDVLAYCHATRVAWALQTGLLYVLMLCLDALTQRRNP
jgi:hypothetical protein